MIILAYIQLYHVPLSDQFAGRHCSFRTKQNHPKRFCPIAFIDETGCQDILHSTHQRGSPRGLPGHSVGVTAVNVTSRPRFEARRQTSNFMIALGIQGGEPLHHMLIENTESGSYAAPLALPQYEPFVTETSDDVQPIDAGYSSGEATVTAESSLIRSRSRLTPSPRSGSLRRRAAATQDCKKHVHADTVTQPGSSVTASGNCKPVPTMRTQPPGFVADGAKPRDATVRGEVPALPTWLPLDRRHARTSCQKPLRSWNRSSALPESPASSAPSSRAKHGLVRSYSFESAAEELYAGSAHHLTTGAYLSMESYSNSDLKRYAREKEGSSAQHPTLVTSDEPGKKFLDTPRHLRIPARRLSEGSSCGSQNGLRPQLSRNFSSTNSVTSYWSRLSANDTDGASSNPDIDDGSPRDGRPYTRLKYGGKLSGKSVYSSGGPASPLSEDGSRLSDANTDIFYGPQRSLEQLKPFMLSALLFGLRLLAVVPATVGSLALVWPILQGNVRDAAGLANALMALPWVSLGSEAIRVFCPADIPICRRCLRVSSVSNSLRGSANAGCFTMLSLLRFFAWSRCNRSVGLAHS